MYLSIKDLAERFSIHPTTIWRWVREERFPKPIKISDRTTRWKASEVDAWAARAEST